MLNYPQLLTQDSPYSCDESLKTGEVCLKPEDLEMFGLFLDETADLLAEWERCCIQYEKSGDKSELDALFRAAHNIKGASRAMGLDKLGGFVHKVENVIMGLREDKLTPNPDLLRQLLDGQSILDNWTQTLRENTEFVPDTTEYEAKLEALVASNGKDGEAAAPAEAASPAPAEATPEKSEPAEATASAGAPAAEAKPAEPAAATPEAKPAAAPPAAPAKPSGGAAAPKREETIRISAQKLGELIQLIGELSIHQSIVWHSHQAQTLDSSRCRNAISLANKITKDIQAKAMTLRMQPVAGLFNRLERISRDIARDQTKKLDVNLQGTTVDLDKTVLERITDPLVHVVRNAVDHGIESTEKRMETGKPEMATVTISAEQDSGGVLITVRDDGGGIDPEKIRKKAIERGIISDGNELSKHELLQLICMPGFSTAAQVTSISGRGVGMDVVKKAIESLGGSLEIDSNMGKGTIFRISLPTNISIVEALIVVVGADRYVVPLRDVEEIIDLNNYAIETTGKKGRMLSLRGAVIPIETLEDYFPPIQTSDEEELNLIRGASALVTVTDGTRIAFEVDRILSQQQVVVRELNPSLSRIPGFVGGTILGDGEPGMIVGLETLVRAYCKRTRREV